MEKRKWWRVVFVRRARDARETKLRALVTVAIYVVLAAALIAFGGDFRNEGLVLVAVQAPLFIGVGILRDRGHLASREVPGGEPESGLWSSGERFEDGK